MKDQSDSYLVEVAKATSDPAVFDELFSRHHKRLRLFMLTKLDEAVVDDVLQEAYIKAFINIRKFDGNSMFSTWLFSISINEYKSYIRKRNSYNKLISFLSFNKKSYSEEPIVDLVLDIDQKVELLTPLQYETFILNLVYGYSHNEVAKLKKIPLGSVKTYISQASKIIRESDHGS